VYEEKGAESRIHVTKGPTRRDAIGPAADDQLSAPVFPVSANTQSNGCILSETAQGRSCVEAVWPKIHRRSGGKAETTTTPCRQNKLSGRPPSPNQLRASKGSTCASPKSKRLSCLFSFCNFSRDLLCFQVGIPPHQCLVVATCPIQMSASPLAPCPLPLAAWAMFRL
jgi:hypothetical protein